MRRTSKTSKRAEAVNETTAAQAPAALAPASAANAPPAVASPAPQPVVTAPAAPPAPRPGTGIYVDVENLRANGQQIVRSLLDSWPEAVPPPKSLCLYVRADLVELWRLWATHQFKGLDIVVKGVQHFSTHSSKNSADIAIATDAISDLLLDQVAYLAVVSDDSDFIALYAAVRDRFARLRPEAERVPFMWVITDRNDTLSTTVRQYFPREAIYVVPFEEAAPGAGSISAPARGGPGYRESYRQGRPQRYSSPAPAPAPPPPAAPPQAVNGPTASEAIPDGSRMAREDETADGVTAEEITDAIVQQVPLGSFRSMDCQQVIRRLWPNHPLANASGPAFGTEFIKRIWPLLEVRGARVLNPGQSPRRYEMTESAKRSVGQTAGYLS